MSVNLVSGVHCIIYFPVNRSRRKRAIFPFVNFTGDLFYTGKCIVFGFTRAAISVFYFYTVSLFERRTRRVMAGTAVAANVRERSTTAHRRARSLKSADRRAGLCRHRRRRVSHYARRRDVSHEFLPSEDVFMSSPCLADR